MPPPVLIIDDSPTLRASLSFCLQNAGYQTLEAENGQEGLDAMAHLKEEGRSISLIITDINMPVMDGIRFIQEVKVTSFRFIPVLVLSTETRAGAERRGQEGRGCRLAGETLPTGAIALGG